MTDPYYDWPMTYFDLQKYIVKKYANPNGIHHYEDANGYEVDSGYYQYLSLIDQHLI